MTLVRRLRIATNCILDRSQNHPSIYQLLHPNSNCILKNINNRHCTRSHFDRRHFHYSHNTQSFADQVKDAVYALTPKSLFNSSTIFSPEFQSSEDPQHDIPRNLPTMVQGINGVRVQLPQYMKDTIQDIPDPSDKIRTLITKYPSISPQIVLGLVSPVEESLSDVALLDVATFLYSRFYTQEACNLLLSNTPFASASSVFVYNFIPRIIGNENLLDRPDFLISNIVSSALSSGYTSLSHQIIADIQDMPDLLSKSYPGRSKASFSPSTLFKDAKMINAIATAKSLNKLTSILGKGTLPDLYIKCQSDFLRVAILKSVFILEEYSLFEELIQLDIAFFTSKFVMRSIISGIHHHYQLSGNLHLLQSLSSIFCKLLKEHRSISIDPIDMVLLPYLATDEKSFNKLWRASRFHLNNILVASSTKTTINETCKDKKIQSSQTDNQTKTVVAAAYKAFFEKSIILKQTYSCVKILKESQKSITDVGLIVRAMNIVIWGRKFPNEKRKKKRNSDETFIENQDENNQNKKKNKRSFDDEKMVYPTNSNIDITNLRRIIWSIPEELIFPSIHTLIYRLNVQFSSEENSSVPGNVIWTILKTLENTRQTAQLTLPIERQLAQLIIRRPKPEQLYYYNLRVISLQGVLFAILAHIDRLKTVLGSEGYQKIEDDTSIKLILSSVLVMKQKSGNLLDPKIFAQVLAGVYGISYPLSKAAINYVKKPLKSGVTDEYISHLISQVQPSDKASIQIVSHLAKQHQFSAAIYYMNRFGESIPPKAVYALLVEASKNCPLICYRIMNWLKFKNITIPTPIIRKVIIGFAQSPLLTDGQSTRRVRNMMQLIWGRHKPIGRETITVFVNSLIARSINTDWGSRDRLKWALNIARREKVSPDQIEKWIQQFDEMRAKRIGYWGLKHRSPSQKISTAYTKNFKMRSLKLLLNYRNRASGKSNNINMNNAIERIDNL